MRLSASSKGLQQSILLIQREWKKCGMQSIIQTAIWLLVLFPRKETTDNILRTFLSMTFSESSPSTVMLINLSGRLMSILALTLVSCLVFLSYNYYIDGTFTFNEQNANREEGLELKVSDIMTDDKVHIEACVNVTEPSDNRRW